MANILCGGFTVRADDVEQAQAGFIELRGNFLDVVDVPCDRMEMLAETVVEFFDRRIAQVGDLGRRHRFHDHVADTDQRSVAPSLRFVAAIEAGDAEDFVVPFVDRAEVVDNMGEMEQLADFEHGRLL